MIIRNKVLVSPISRWTEEGENHTEPHYLLLFPLCMYIQEPDKEPGTEVAKWCQMNESCGIFPAQTCRGVRRRELLLGIAPSIEHIYSKFTWNTTPPPTTTHTTHISNRVHYKGEGKEKCPKILGCRILYGPKSRQVCGKWFFLGDKDHCVFPRVSPIVWLQLKAEKALGVEAV